MNQPNYILAIEYASHCDLLRVPLSAYAAVCFALNQQTDCRYWVHFHEYVGHEFNGPTYLQFANF